MKSSPKKRKHSNSNRSSKKQKVLDEAMQLEETLPSAEINTPDYSTFGYDSFYEFLNVGDPLEQILAQSSIQYAAEEATKTTTGRSEDEAPTDQTPPPKRKPRKKRSETNKVETRASTRRSKGARYVQLDKTLLQGASIYLKSPKEFEYFMGKLHPLKSSRKSPHARAEIYSKIIATMVLGQYQHDELDPKVQVGISPELLCMKSTVLIYHKAIRTHTSIFFLLFEYAQKASDVQSVFTIIDYYLSKKRGVQGIKLPNLEGVQSSLGDMIKGYCAAVKWYPSELAEWFRKYDEETHKILSESITNHASFKTSKCTTDTVALDAFFEKDERVLSNPFATFSSIPLSAKILPMENSTTLSTIQAPEEEDVTMTFKITPNGLTYDHPQSTQNILL